MESFNRSNRSRSPPYRFETTTHRPLYDPSESIINRLERSTNHRAHQKQGDQPEALSHLFRLPKTPQPTNRLPQSQRTANVFMVKDRIYRRRRADGASTLRRTRTGVGETT
ncbi:Uncharacterized protein Rs2_08981 [Raphanus sativus]|nr:Uncharacterized protein Rs2_08981 [Raphanus sativus]